ncbi:uncharacterized protein EI90DRAFT_3015465 [Cantharellus anzutake]|uniref:uncharacterized protein n=1 Tax=Cantharellus anzutake TaxID=1750568 RepID=UPI001907D45C|nr:uncharacterized protein EI90DRAFT_3015465 [Cantharellus anzutake]KAF8333626.1 hypothetical protein EI90DRAFT_3015465 [Cantharellus anzutake]
MSVAFGNIDAIDLTLWKVSIPADSFEGRVELQDQPALLSLQTLSSIFSDPPSNQNLHIVVDPPLFKLYCRIRGRDASHTLLINIANKEKVIALKEAIQKKSPTLDRIFADAIILWMVSIPFDGSYEENVKNAELTDANMLPSMQTLSDAFWPRPQDGSLHVIVQIPHIGKRPQLSDEVDLARKSKLARTAPSSISKQPEYGSLQRMPNERILDDRPTLDSIPPVSLLYHGFGRFWDLFSSYPALLNKDLQNIELAVDSFAEKMTELYPDEAMRKIEGLRTLNGILSLRNRPKLMGADIDGSRTDGHYNGPHNAASCVVEFKNELSEAITLMPVVRLASYVAHSHKVAMEHSSGEALFKGWRVPCLGLTVVGPYITFHAVIYLGQWRIISLTPTLSCIASASEGRDRKTLYAAFFAALSLLSDIDSDAAYFMDTLPQLEHGNYKFPYISKLPGYNNTKEINFQILELHPDVHDGRHLYIANLGTKQIIVKFAHQYSIELHALCANEGHAPKILGYEELPGGWFGIAMDYITPTVHPLESDNLVDHYEKWADELCKLMQIFHDANFVHGDLREPNILCSEDKVMLIDFDWGGKVGEVQYPSQRLCPELMDGRGDEDLEIKKADDVRILGNTLQTLKEKAGYS